MKPMGLWAALVCIWVVTHFWLLPLTREHWKAADMHGKGARAGVLVTLEKLRDLAAVGAIAVATVMVLVALAGVLAGSAFEVPKGMIDALASVYGVAKSWGEAYGTVLVWLGLVGAGVALFLAARHARRRVTTVWIDKANAMHAALREDPSRIDAARADPELRPLIEQFDAILAAIGEDRAAEERGVAPDATARARLESELGRAVLLLAVEMARKQVDFGAAAGAPSGEDDAPPSTWRRIANVLASDRFGRDMGLVRKPLSVVVTGLLFVSLIGWAAEPMADSLRLSVNNLRVNLIDRDARRELDTALSRDAAPEPATEAGQPPRPDTTQAASRVLARAIAHELARAPVLDRIVGVQRSALARAEFVRAALVEQQIIPAAAPDDAAARVRSEVADVVGKGGHAANAPSGLQQHLEAELRVPLQEVQSRQPRRLRELLVRLEARYAAPMAPLEAQGVLMARVLDEAFGAVDAAPSSELGKQAQKLVKDFGTKAVKTWANAAVKQFLADTLADIARPEVRRVFAFEMSTEGRAFVESLHASEGRGWRPSKAAEADSRASQAVARRVADLYLGAPEAERAALVSRLGGYERLFPIEDGPYPPPHEGAPIGPAGGGGGGGGGSSEDRERAVRKSAPPPPERGHRFAQSRATSVRLASSSFRVRGVLIGQDVGGPPLDVTDIRSLVQPARSPQTTRVELQVRIASDAEALPTWRSAGTFDAGVLNQALRYAADRRVVATTITGGDGRSLRRVTYLHPVLADTPLGCRVVEADRFIDTFTFAQPGDPVTPAGAAVAADREEMFRWMRTLALAEPIAALHAAQCPLAEVQRAVSARRLERVRFSRSLTAALDRFISEREKSSPQSTPLLRTATACANEPAESLAGCLCTKVKPVRLGAGYWFPEDHTSQLRERTAMPSADLAWLKPSPDRLAHFDFWIHTTFSLRDGSSGESDESTATALDFPGPHLAALRSMVAERLPSYLTRQLRTGYDEFMAPLEEFVLAQRLFRAAFTGGLGRDFPLTRLVDLEKETRRYVPMQPTIRWEPAGTRRDLLEALRDAAPEAEKSYLAWEAGRIERDRARRPVCDRASL